MSYGVSIRGDSGQTTIDDSNPCTHIVVSGTYGARTTSETIAGCPSTIQSPYEPYVYFRLNGPHQIYLFRHIGSPGNWTGFAFRQSIYRDVGPPVYGGEWKVGAVMLPKTGGRGMQVFDTQPRVMFDNSRDTARYLGGAQVWNKHAYNLNWSGGLALQTWCLPFSYGVEAHLQVNHFNISAFITAEAPRTGFLENSMSLILVPSIVQTRTNQQFNWSLIAVV